MSGDYPTEDELATIRAWDAADLPGWFAYVKSVGNYWPDECFGWSVEDGKSETFTERPVTRYHISTGGWSGNEDILDAMRENQVAWMMTWQQTRRGGHFIFEVPHA